MNPDELHDALAVIRGPSVDRLLELMNKVKVVDLTMPEILGVVAVFESADARMSAVAAPVFQLHNGGCQR
jgi:hypothetical protein